MAQMTQEELDSRLATVGGGKLVHSQVAAKKRIPNPNYNAVAVAAGRSNEPEFIEVDVEQWKSPEGHTIQAMHNADGTWEVVQDEPAAPKPSAPTETSASKRTAREEAEIAANAALPADQDPRSETNAERAARSDARIKQQGADAQAQQQKDDTTVTDVSYTGTGKNRQKVTTYKSDRKVTEAAPQQATPTSVAFETRGGKSVKVTKYDDGTETVEEKDPATIAAEQRAGRVTIDGRLYEVVPGQNGGQSSLREIKNPNDKPPPDLPAMRLEAGKISEELKQLWEDLNARVRRGEITREQAKSEFEGRYATAQARMAEIDSTVKTQQALYQNQLTQRGQDLGETQSRRSAATSAANEAASYVNQHSGKAGPHGPSLSAAADAMIDRAYRTQERFGATREAPAVQLGPAAQAANSLTLPGMPSPSTPMATAGAATSELGQPGDPTMAGNAAAAAQARANPVFRPQPPANLTPPAVQGTPSPLGDTGAPPVGSEGDSLGAAQKILTPMPGSSSASGSTGADDDMPPALASLLEIEMPGGIKMRFNGQGQPSTAMASGQGQQQGGGDDESDRIKRMRDLAPDDPNWQRSLDEQERRYGRPTPQSMFAA